MQKNLKAKLEKLSREQLLALLEELGNPVLTVDPYALRELVQAIYVDAPDKSSGKRRQKIHIEYDGIGFIPLEELAKKETA